MSVLYFDGGAAPNPGPMHIGIMLDQQPSFKRLERHGTNNIAEWAALCWGVGLAVEKGIKVLEVFGDSKLIVNQANGLWKINERSFLPFKEEYDRYVSQFEKITLKHVRRNINLAGVHIEQNLKA
jgi:ribonuclease HI